MNDVISREVRLRERPTGIPNESDFEIAEIAIRKPSDKEILVRNIYISVDPYMRGRMRGQKSYVEPFPLGQTMKGGCVGQIVSSNNEAYQIGEYVLSMNGWREYYISDGKDLTKIHPSEFPIQAYLGVLGMPGMTAYVGLLDIGGPKENETVFVSAASGAVGSVVCQIAKIKGCHVVGSAGSDVKVKWLVNEIGVDSALNYKATENLTTALRNHCPNGIDIYFENVGGSHLEAVLANMNPYGRIPVCGMISQYNQPQPGPRNLTSIIVNRLLLKGFIVSDHSDRMPQFYSDMEQWIRDGKITWKETIIDGIQHASSAFIGLFTGENLGKMLVKVGPDPTIKKQNSS
jgi:NADPH-dependent curcumin reductase CurA